MYMSVNWTALGIENRVPLAGRYGLKIRRQKNLDVDFSRINENCRFFSIQDFERKTTKR